MTNVPRVLLSSLVGQHCKADVGKGLKWDTLKEWQLQSVSEDGFCLIEFVLHHCL